MSISISWLRRDLRLDDNTALNLALKSGRKVLVIFIFDTDIIDELEKNDARINFIYGSLQSINEQLKVYGSSLLCMRGKCIGAWEKIISQYDVSEVYANKDYEPYARRRDEMVAKLLATKNIKFNVSKDQVIFEENEILKKDFTPYTVFTPYKNQWKQKFAQININDESVVDYQNLYKINIHFPLIEELGFEKSNIKVKPINYECFETYSDTRNLSEYETTQLGPHLRFGTISVRKLINMLPKTDDTLLDELIWREFFMQILFHFPQVEHRNFKKKYDNIIWLNNEQNFELWKNGQTGYPLVDAGMRELNETGYMHNRVRMVVASFLCKHLLINWQWGEAYFAQKLLDYELSSNNGNWQWAAGTGCDAAPYFRVFNPSEQIRKFDKNMIYTRKWVNDIDSLTYPKPIVEHTFARQRAIETYKKYLTVGNNTFH